MEEVLMKEICKNFGEHQLELVNKLSFVRYGGTPEEEKAARIIMEEIEQSGGSCELVPFQIPAFECSKCSITVTEPYNREIEAVPFGCTGSVEGDFDLIYVERGEEMDYAGLRDLSNTVVLVNRCSYEAYRQICDRKPAAFIAISGKYYDTPDNSDLVAQPLRYEYRDMGRVPGFIIRAKDATELVRDRVSRIHVELQQEEKEATSHDVLAVIPGTEDLKGDIVLTAHYDSILVGTGSWDNATGSVNLLHLYKYFLRNPAKRTLRFVWCGSEEQGLFGSHAYIEQNPDLVDRISFCFNFDMNGTVLGPNEIFITGGEDLKTYVEQYCREVGYSASKHIGVHSSDSAPFCDKGIPALGLSRGTNTAEIHTRRDLVGPLGADQLQDIGVFSSGLVARVANSVILPVERKLDDKMKEELDKYFYRAQKRKDEEKRNPEKKDQKKD